MTDYCRRCDQWLSPFWPKFFAVLTNCCRRFDQCLSPFWLMVVAVLTRVVAVLTTVVAVLECRRFGMSPFLLSPFRLVAVMTGTRIDNCSFYVLLNSFTFLVTVKRKWYFTWQVNFMELPYLSGADINIMINLTQWWQLALSGCHQMTPRLAESGCSDRIVSTAGMVAVTNSGLSFILVKTLDCWVCVIEWTQWSVFIWPLDQSLQVGHVYIVGGGGGGQV